MRHLTRYLVLIASLMVLSAGRAAEPAKRLNFAGQAWIVPQGYVVEDRNSLYFSKDGIEFTLVREFSDEDPISVVANADGTKWSVACRNSLHVLRPDGSEAGPVITVPQGVLHVVVGPDKILALVFGGTIWQAKPGEPWQSAPSPTGAIATDGAWGKGVWVLTGYTPTEPVREPTPPVEEMNANNYSSSPPPEEAEADVAPTPQPPARLWISSDAIRWQNVALSEALAARRFNWVSANSHGFFAIHDGSHSVFSPDGRNWSILPGPMTNDDFLNQATVVGGEFAIRADTSAGPVVWLSADARTWRKEKLHPEASLASLISDPRRALVFGRSHQTQPFRVGAIAEFEREWLPPVSEAKFPGATLPSGCETIVLNIFQYVSGSYQESAAQPLTRLRRQDGALIALLGQLHAIGPRAAKLFASGIQPDATPLDMIYPDGKSDSNGDMLYVTESSLRLIPNQIKIKAPKGSKFTALTPVDGGGMAVGTNGLVAGWINNDTRQWPSQEAFGDLADIVAGDGLVVSVGSRRLPNESELRIGGFVYDGDSMIPLSTLAGDCPLPLRAVAYTGKEFVAVGPQGFVLTSTDAKKWTLGEISGQPDLTHVAGIGGRAYATATDGTIYMKDFAAVAWQVVARAPQTNWVGIFDDGNRIAAYTREGQLLRLPEQVTALPGATALAMSDPSDGWKRVARLAAEKMEEIKVLAARKAAEAKVVEERRAKEARALAAKKFVGTSIALSDAFYGEPSGMCWDGEQLLVTAYAGIYRSSDGHQFNLWIPRRDNLGYAGLREAGGRVWTWSIPSLQYSSELFGFPPDESGKLSYHQKFNGRITGIAGTNDKLALITDAYDKSYVYTSEDRGNSWTSSPVQVGSLMPMQYGLIPGRIGPDIAFGNDRWVAVGRQADDTTVAAVSTDLIHWKMVPLGGPKGGMMKIVFFNGRFVASGHQYYSYSEKDPWTIASSADGENWQLATINDEYPGLVDVAGGRLYAHNRTGLFTSEDARSWRRLTSHPPVTGFALAVVGEKLMIVGEPVLEGRVNEPQYSYVGLAVPSAAAILAAPSMDDIRDQKGLAALKTFEHSIMTASGYESLAEPAATLVKALDAMPDKTLANVIMPVLLELLQNKGGARAYLDFQMALSEQRFAEGQKFSQTHLSPAQKVILRGLGGQVYSRVVGGTVKGVDTSTWVPASYSGNFRKKNDDLLDIDKVYLALLHGAAGAAMDLEAAYTYGSGSAQHQVAAEFWHAVVGQRSHEMENTKITPPQALRQAAELGSVFALADLADELQRQNDGKPNDEIFALRRRAMAGGLNPGSTDSAIAEPTAQKALQLYTPPRLFSPLLANSPEAQAIFSKPEYRLPLSGLAQEEAAYAAVISGVTAAINQGDPASLIAHLAGWLRVRRAAEELAGKDSNLKLPARALHKYLLTFIEPAERAGLSGTALLIRYVIDRADWYPGRWIDEIQPRQTGDFNWLRWRAEELKHLSAIMPVQGKFAAGEQLYALPPWSPILRHPAELFDRRFVPLLMILDHERLSSPLLSSASLRIDPSAVLVEIPETTAGLAALVIAGRTRSLTVRVRGVNQNFGSEVAARDSAIADLDAKIAALDAKIAANPPVTEKRVSKRVAVGSENVSSYRTRGINENGPGTKQGDQVYTGTFNRTIYQDVVEVQKSPNLQHPLYVERNNLVGDRTRLRQQPAPSLYRDNSTDTVTTHYDRWSASPVLRIILKDGTSERTLRLRVPMTYELPRASGQSAPSLVLGSAGLRRMLADPAGAGAAAVHRAVSVFLLEERLRASLGENRAKAEAALIGELLFGFEPDGGTVLQALRDLDRPPAQS